MNQRETGGFYRRNWSDISKLSLATLRQRRRPKLLQYAKEPKDTIRYNSGAVDEQGLS